MVVACGAVDAIGAFWGIAWEGMQGGLGWGSGEKMCDVMGFMG